MTIMGTHIDLINIVNSLYNFITSSILLINQIGLQFLTTVGVKQGFLLSTVVFNLILDIIMQDILENHQSIISIEGRLISNLRFADDIDILSDSISELQALT